jgi:hypothetical protein
MTVQRAARGFAEAPRSADDARMASAKNFMIEERLRAI